MASVEVVKGKNPRKVMVETIVYDEIFNLSLSKDEAQALKWVLEKVGGDPDRTPRKHINEIHGALCRARLGNLDWPTSEKFNTLYFGNKVGS